MTICRNADTLSQQQGGKKCAWLWEIQAAYSRAPLVSHLLLSHSHNEGSARCVKPEGLPGDRLWGLAETCPAKAIQLSSSLLMIKKTLGLFPRLPITQMYSVSGWMALRWLIAGQPGERFDPKWLFLLSLSFKIHTNIPFSSFFHRNWTDSRKVHWANGCEIKWIVSHYKHSVIFLSVRGDNFNLNFVFCFVKRCTCRSAAAVTASSIALSLLGNVPRRQSWASQPQKHMSYPLRQIRHTNRYWK